MTAAQLYTLAPMVAHDQVDAYLMSLYSRLNLTPYARMMLLSGLAGFSRSIKED
jgi:hypothetical protein